MRIIIYKCLIDKGENVIDMLNENGTKIDPCGTPAKVFCHRLKWQIDWFIYIATYVGKGISKKSVSFKFSN